MRNWPATTPTASFKGVPFQVESEGTDGAGRAVALHAYAKAETHGTEDMSRKYQGFRVEAYVASDAADAEAEALISACSSPGPGLLVLPMTPPKMVYCIQCDSNAAKNTQGMVAFALRFVEEGADAGGFPAIPLGDRIAASVLDTLPGLISGAISRIPLR